MKKFTNLNKTLTILTLFISLTILSPLTVYAGGTPTPAPAAGGGNSAINDIRNGAVVADPGGSTINNAVQTGVTLFSWLVGVVAVLMIIFGGYKYITGAGDTNKYAEARKTIIYALVGLVLVAVSQVIVRIVIVKSIKL